MGIPDLKQAERDMVVRIQPQLSMVTDVSGTIINTRQPGQRLVVEEKIAWNAESLAALWDQAGVHRYGETGDVIYAGRGWLVIHSVSGGEKILELPFAARVTDPGGHRITLTDNASTVLLNMKQGEIERASGRERVCQYV